MNPKPASQQASWTPWQGTPPTGEFHPEIPIPLNFKRFASSASARPQTKRANELLLPIYCSSPHRKPRCIAVCLLRTPASTASQKARHPPGQAPKKLTGELASKASQKGTDSQKADMQCCFRFCLGPVEDNDHRRPCQSPPAGMPRRL